jgi:hypothetical protein
MVVTYGLLSLLYRWGQFHFWPGFPQAPLRQLIVRPSRRVSTRPISPYRWMGRYNILSDLCLPVSYNNN